MSQNEVRCGGGLGWIGPGLYLYGAIAIALLITLIALVTALIVAFARHRWLWIIALFLAIALDVLVVMNSASLASHDLVGTVFGFGCSRYYSMVAQSLVPLVVAAPSLAFLLVERRH